MVENVIPKIACDIPIYVSWDKSTVKHYGGIWDPIKTKPKKVKQKYQKQHCQNYFRCGKNARVFFLRFQIFYYYYMYALNIISLDGNKLLR